MKDKPFALVGVNIAGHDAKDLKEVVEREKLTWRSLADAGALGQGAIATRWNLTSTPTLYVIDHRGVIRHKWLGAPGEKVIDAALDKLIEEAERSGKDAPK
ncbi:MAG: TlpA family protein disulfide reductase [Planctomycetia bacterium]|nr:TlpA family protein disulfide reductase [Planctomycetia bacterium]